MKLQTNGLHENTVLSSRSKGEIATFITKLNQVDYGSVAFKLINSEEGEAWTLEQATTAIERYRQFLLLSYLYPDRDIVPDREIDRVWHTAILDTEKYAADCLATFGYFVHHYPFFGIIDAEDRKALEFAFVETCTLLEQHFI